ncbi:MAG: WbqC family protein [Myxococcales bacterium]|nr:WbqC family protein [Myxococcales bacterium]
MIVAAHQPHYLPWIGYLAKIAACDLFVVMDDLQYEAQNFQNRNRVKINHGAAWLTVPLVRGPQSELIRDKRIRNDVSGKENWQRRTWQTLEIHYRRAPYWHAYADALYELYHRPWERLLALDLHVLSLMMRWFDVKRPVLLASSLALSGQKTERIAALCGVVNADVYLSGRGASTAYLDVALLRARGVDVAWQQLAHPVYEQRYPGCGFVSHLAAIDLVLNCGPASPRILADAMAVAAPAAAVGGRR